MKGSIAAVFIALSLIMFPSFMWAQQDSAGKSQNSTMETRLWSVGASLGTSFNTPWIIGTIRGTIAPFNYSFLELGLDAGIISGLEGIGHYSLCPFVHYSYFRPVGRIGSLYAGAGAGFVLAGFKFTEGKVKKNDFVMDLAVGFIFFGFLDVSYTFRTNFSGVCNKVSVGYTYRFD